MNLLETYRSEARLSFMRTGDPRSERILTALIEVPDGLVVTDGNAFDPWAGKSWARLEGTLDGEGPWTIGDWTIEVASGDDPMEASWKDFESFAPEGYREKLESWLKEMHS